MSLLDRALRVAGNVARDLLRSSSRSTTDRTSGSGGRSGSGTSGSGRSGSGRGGSGQGGSGQGGSGQGGSGQSGSGRPTPSDPRTGSGSRPSGSGSDARTEYPHTVREFDTRRGLPPLSYAPEDDGDADPGEVVWAWVPYEENDGRGKDRPVLILARHEKGFLGLQLTSKDHDRDAADEARWGRHWLDIGSGGWDSQRRPSEVRLDRVLFLPADAVRREGAAVDRDTYAMVSDALHALHGR